ncbi:CHASE3 domain-containing protein [Thalassotalea sp. SU-HH00458]|uniref:CHASE3 domain-containing protein n=1 Tax=Thalassotalea sp. SU-HH00458 TaxID=3127657 RepID=UPI0031091BBA
MNLSNFFSLNHLSIRKKIIIGLVVPIIFLCFTSSIIYLSILKQKESTFWVEHTHKVISGGHELIKLLLDMETGERGFLVTGNELFLEPYHKALVVWSEKLDSLRHLVSDNPIQVQRLDKIKKLQIKWLELAADVEIQARREVKDLNGNVADLSHVIILLEKGTGKNIFDEIRQVKSDFIDEENRLMLLRKTEELKTAQQTKLFIIIGTLLAIMISGIIFISIQRGILRNLTILSTGADKISQGDFDALIQIDSNDEFLQLADDFNLMAKSLKYSMHKMEASVKSKSEFLANMSHEIRTPMNGILGMLILLEDTELSEEQNECVNSIRSCGDGLLLVINDILDLSKLEAGMLSIDSQPFSLDKMVGEVCFLLDAQASNKGLILKANIHDDTPDSLMGDSLRIRQVLLNLMGNAIKFSDQGTISLSIKSIGIKEGKQGLFVEVKDSGIGISASDQEKLFKPFSQVDSSISRKYGGTGLGLIISAQLIKQMGGKISVKSELGKGSTFSFYLYLEATSSLVQKDKIVESNQVIKENKTLADQIPLAILIAEDNHINQVIARKVFTKLGYDVDVVENGAKALTAAVSKSYDAIFMDMQMPVMDGITSTIKILTSLPDNPPTIIAMTANVLEADKQKCFDAGMTYFLSKPIDVEEVVKVIKMLS